MSVCCCDKRTGNTPRGRASMCSACCSKMMLLPPCAGLAAACADRAAGSRSVCRACLSRETAACSCTVPEHLLCVVMAGCYFLQMDQKPLNTCTLHIYVDFLHEGPFSWIAVVRAACTERYTTLLISRPSRPWHSMLASRARSRSHMTSWWHTLSYVFWRCCS